MITVPEKMLQKPHIIDTVLPLNVNGSLETAIILNSERLGFTDKNITTLADVLKMPNFTARLTPL